MAVSCADFEFVRKLVHEHSSISLGSGKEYLVEARLAPLARREGLASIAELVGVLRLGGGGGGGGGGGTRLRDDVVHAMATHETSFFRDLHPFEALRQNIIPSILESNGGRRLSMWSCAASTGQEAYSLALVVREHFPRISDLTILATDLAPDVLDRARQGRFSQLDVNRGLPAPLLVKYFERHGREWELKAEVRNMVTFIPLNLARPLRGVPPMDVVFLRNVLIYFEKPAKAALLKEVARVLRPGGYLILGGSETTYGIDDSYERLQIGKTSCYRLATTTGAHGPDVRH